MQQPQHGTTDLGCVLMVLILPMIPVVCFPWAKLVPYHFEWKHLRKCNGTSFARNISKCMVSMGASSASPYTVSPHEDVGVLLMVTSISSKFRVDELSNVVSRMMWIQRGFEEHLSSFKGTTSLCSSCLKSESPGAAYPLNSSTSFSSAKFDYASM